MKVEVRAVGLKVMSEKRGLTLGCRFEELFQVVLVDSETGKERVLLPGHAHDGGG